MELVRWLARRTSAGSLSFDLFHYINFVVKQKSDKAQGSGFSLGVGPMGGGLFGNFRQFSKPKIKKWSFWA